MRWGTVCKNDKKKSNGKIWPTLFTLFLIFDAKKFIFQIWFDTIWTEKFHFIHKFFCFLDFFSPMPFENVKFFIHNELSHYLLCLV